MVKVLIKRYVGVRDRNRLLGLLLDLRAGALHQPGYVSGETVIRGEDPVEVLTIGGWLTEDHWRAWLTSEQRHGLENMVSPLLVGEAEIAVYNVPHDVPLEEG